MADKQVIPKLPYGMGTISPYRNGMYMYKKAVKDENGNMLRHSEYGASVQEVIRKMDRFEKNIKNLKREKAALSQLPLYEAMMLWADGTRARKGKRGVIYGRVLDGL